MVQPPPPVNPYAAPTSSLLPPARSNVVMSTGGTIRPVVGVSRWLVGLFALFVLTALVFEGTLVSQLELLGRIDRGAAFTQAETETNDIVVGLVALVHVTLLLPLTILWIVWQRRCRLNLEAIGVEALQFTPAASIYWWFVPIANYFMPWQVMTEIWRASSAAAEGEDDWPARVLPGWLSAWWATWVARAVLGAASNRFEGPQAAELITATYVLMAATLASLTCASLAIVVVVRITDAQRRAIERTRMA